MGMCYYFYNPNTLEEIDSGKFSGMPFWNDNVNSYGLVKCALRLYTDKKEWSTDEYSELYHYVYDDPYCSDWCEYITIECAEKMQNDMEVNKTLFTDLMDRSECNALIMDVSY